MRVNRQDNSLASPERAKLGHLLRQSNTLGRKGRIVQAHGTTIRVSGLQAGIGQQCKITHPVSKTCIYADVVGLDKGECILMPLGSLQGVAVDSEVELVSVTASVPLGESLLGRVIDGLGKPIDGKTLSNCIEQPLYQDAPNPLSREPITTAFHTGVRAIDGVLTTGLGQRMGIFAVAGGGKSTLLSMMAKQAVADVIVIALIGERGREVREFIEHNLGEQGMARSVLVVATSDRPSMERARAAYTATAIAEGFRDQGKNVLLLMDSATRFARALREIGLSVGEPAVRRGFPPSVFAELPRLFERTGSNDKGTITAFYTVLVEDEDAADPVAEEVRSILDGHIVLSRQLGQEGHYPAIDVLGSASRIFNAITEPVHQQWAMHLRKLLAEYKKVEFLIQVGEYQQGADPVADEAIQKREALKRFLCQDVNDHQSFDNTLQLLAEAVGV